MRLILPRSIFTRFWKTSGTSAIFLNCWQRSAVDLRFIIYPVNIFRNLNISRFSMKHSETKVYACIPFATYENIFDKRSFLTHQYGFRKYHLKLVFSKIKRFLDFTHRRIFLNGSLNYKLFTKTSKRVSVPEQKTRGKNLI